MEENDAERSRDASAHPPLPLSALRLLVPPLRLISAAIWQTIQQKVVADYGMLEEFVSMVTDIVPELLTSHQRAQLSLGLRARAILELCQLGPPADSESVQPHLDRMQTLIEGWLREAGDTNAELPHSNFVDLVKNLLANPDEKEQFFQKAFLEEFGPMYDSALHTLMRLFLSRLEKFFPLQTFEQVAGMLSETSSVLEDSIQSVSQCEELRTLLQCQKDPSQLDHNESLLDGACIISALKLPFVERTPATQGQDNFLDVVPSCASELQESVTLPHTAQIKTGTTTEKRTSGTQTDKSNWSPGKDGTPLLLGDGTRHDRSVNLLQSQEADASCPLKECQVQLKRVDIPLSSHFRPVRKNKGLKMKKILLEEGREVEEEAGCKSAVRKKKQSNKTQPPVSDKEDSSSLYDDHSYQAPLSTCSDDSWSYYSDDGSGHGTFSGGSSMADSWSYYSDDESSFMTPRSSSPENDSFYTFSMENPSISDSENASACSRKPDIPDIKAKTPKKARKIQCFVCKEHLSMSLTSHLKIHFPNGVYACPQCDRRFKLASSLKQHLTKTCFEHGFLHINQEKPDETRNLYKCDKCEEAFRYKISLQQHSLTHNELYCNVCRKVLRDAETLMRHKASHTLFQCNRCDKSFTLFKPLLRHCENIHQTGKLFKCNHCPKTYRNLRLLIIHEWHHTGNLPFKCIYCNLRFKCDADLIYHERVHTGEKPFLCAECGKTFSHKSNLVRHLNLTHGESRNEKKHSCSQCEKSFKEKGALKKHQRSKHLNELFRNPCPYCGKMISASTMARHKLIHTGEKPFQCTVPECGKFFRSKTEVNRHVLVHHTAERPHKCDVCGKGFVKMCFLKAHAKIHSGEKPFVCHICGKAFLKAYSMLRHKRLLHSIVKH